MQVGNRANTCRNYPKYKKKVSAHIQEYQPTNTIIPRYSHLLIINGYETIQRVKCVYWIVCKKKEAIQEKRGL